MKMKLKKGSRGRREVCPVQRLPLEQRKPLKQAIAEAVKTWVATIEQNVNETFDYSAIELRVVWSFDNTRQVNYRELIITTEGRKSR